MNCENARLLMDVDTGPTEGGWNMAVDEAILQTANQTGRTTVRFYGWQPATLSLGYFQRWDDRLSHADSYSCPIVRRSTGGGAILHDRELTYSICLPSQNRWCHSHEDLYWKIHRGVIQWLGQHSIVGALYGEESPLPTTQVAGCGTVDRGDHPFREQIQQLVNDIHPLQTGQRFVGDEPFLCFLRRTAGDVVLDGYKIMGSAQRRKRNALLQHGSLLLGQSEYAPQLPGILQLAPTSNVKLLATRSLYEPASELVCFFEEALEMSLVAGELTDSETELSQQIQLEQASDSWLKKR